MPDFTRPVVGTIYDSKAGQRTVFTLCVGGIDPARLRGMYCLRLSRLITTSKCASRLQTPARLLPA